MHAYTTWRVHEYGFETIHVLVFLSKPSIITIASNIQILGVIHYSSSHRPVITPMRPLCPAAVQCHRELKKEYTTIPQLFLPKSWCSKARWTSEGSIARHSALLHTVHFRMQGQQHFH